MCFRCRTRSGATACGSGLSLTLLMSLLLAACHREHREFEAPPDSDLAPTQVALNSLVAGQASAQFREQQRHEYEDSAYHLSEGKRLFSYFNCTGCHAHGGGGSGPALMDDRWIYGGEIDQIYLTIVQGRPNGMPAFGGKIPSQQVWELAAYVRSLGGYGAAEPRRSPADPGGAGQAGRTPPYRACSN